MILEGLDLLSAIIAIFTIAFLMGLAFGRAVYSDEPQPGLQLRPTQIVEDIGDPQAIELLRTTTGVSPFSPVPDGVADVYRRRDPVPFSTRQETRHDKEAKR